MANTDRYIMGLIENLENLTGTLSSPLSINGRLSNATLRGERVELRMNDQLVLQWRYEDEDDTAWRDLIDLSVTDYETLLNLPTVNGEELRGELSGIFMLVSDEITEQELTNILND